MFLLEDEGEGTALGAPRGVSLWCATSPISPLFHITLLQLPGRARGASALHLSVVGGETTRMGESGRSRGLVPVARCQVGLLEKHWGQGRGARSLEVWG